MKSLKEIYAEGEKGRIPPLTKELIEEVFSELFHGKHEDRREFNMSKFGKHGGGGWYNLGMGWGNKAALEQVKKAVEDEFKKSL